VNLWAGETVSIFGTMVGGLALQFTAIVTLDAGPPEVALLALFGSATRFVVAPVAGVVVDRVRRRPLMIGADMGRALALATVPAAALVDAVTMEHLYLVAAVLALLTVFFDIAYQAYLPGLVGREHVVEGNSKLAASASVAEISGFSVSGWLVQVFRGPGAVAVDAATFVWSAVFLWRIRAPEAAAAPVAERQPMLRGALEGVRTVAANPVLVSLTLAAALTGMADRVVGVLFLLYLVDDVGFSPGVLGVIFAVGGATSLFGAWVAGQGWLRPRLGMAMVAALFLGALGLLGMPLAESTGAVGIGLLVANQLVSDPARTFYEIHELSIRQQVTSDEVLGRVNATVQFSVFTAALAGTGVAALAGELWGARTGLFIACGIMASGGLSLLASSAVRGFAATPQRVDVGQP
jgi:MFS family permease